MISCLLLTAGLSSRFHSPKALARLGEDTVIEHLQKTLINTQLSEIVVVLGAEFETLSKDEQSKLKIDGGVKITKLGGGKLRAAGIREGFIVTQIDRKEIKTTDELVKVFENKKGGVLIEGVYPNGMRAYYAFGL